MKLLPDVSRPGEYVLRGVWTMKVDRIVRYFQCEFWEELGEWMLQRDVIGSRSARIGNNTDVRSRRKLQYGRLETSDYL